MSKFAELQKKHERLLSTQIVKEIKKSEAQEFINEIVDGSQKVTSSRERDQLRANLRYWANYVYEETGAYPDVELLPSTTSVFSSILIGFFVFRMMIALVYLGSKQWQSYTISLTPVVTPYLECPVQPANQLLDISITNNQKLIYVLFDGSASYLQFKGKSVDLILTAVLPELHAGDRLIFAWIGGGVSGDTILLDEQVPLVEFQVLQPTPVPPSLVPTLVVQGTTLQRVSAQATNAAISASNDTIVQQVYYCEIGSWNSEYEKALNDYFSRQSLAEEDFRKRIGEVVERAISQKQPENTSAIYDSIYLASRFINNSIDHGEYVDYTLLIFSDMVEYSSQYQSQSDSRLNLSGVNVIVTQYCTVAVECSETSYFWEQEFRSLDVKDVTILLPIEISPEKLRELIKSSAP